MKRPITVALTTALVISCPSLALAQDSYTMKFKDLGKGETVRVEKVESDFQKFKISLDGGQELDSKDEKSTKTTFFTETILELPDPKKAPTKLKRVYEKAQIKKGETTETLGIQGKAVIIEKKEDVYRFSFEGGGDLAAQDFDLLDKEFNKKDKKESEFAKKFLPSDTLKIGEEWKLPVQDLVKELDLGNTPIIIDMDKAIATGKLTKVSKKDNSDFGHLVFKISLPLKQIKTPEFDIDFRPGATFDLNFSILVCIDGTRAESFIDLSGAMTGAAVLDAKGITLTMDISAGMNGHWSIVEVRKKP